MTSAFLSLIVFPELTKDFEAPPVNQRNKWREFLRKFDAQSGVQKNIFRRVMRKLGIACLHIPDADSLIALRYIVYGRGAVVHPARRS